MLKKILSFVFVVVLLFSFVSCGSDDPQKEEESKKAVSEVTEETSKAVQQGDPEPTFTVDWPADMLPDDFPNLGKVTKVYDSRAFVKKITINWNIISEQQVKEIVDQLNAYLDYDHAWQDYFYSDGIKYKTGTEDEFINVVIRYSPSASGQIEPNLEPQFYLEISGEGIKDEN